MKRTTLVAIAVAAAVVLVPTLLAVAQGEPTNTQAAECPHFQDMDTEHRQHMAQAGMPCPIDGQGMMKGRGMGMMGGNGMGMMGGDGMGMMNRVGASHDDCPMFTS